MSKDTSKNPAAGGTLRQWFWISLLVVILIAANGARSDRHPLFPAAFLVEGISPIIQTRNSKLYFEFSVGAFGSSVEASRACSRSSWGCSCGPSPPTRPQTPASP
jgi:hypothetical protein